MSRYYDSNGSSEDIKPGKLSAELREALNIPENELPIWIYRMRALGYPPGWMKQAIVDTNDIFDTDLDSDKSRKRKTPSDEVVRYDHSKFIEYPGFNAPLPEGCNDYHYYLNMPAMLRHQQLDYAKQQLASFEPEPAPKRIRSSMETNESCSKQDSSNTSGIGEQSRSDKDTSSPPNLDESNSTNDKSEPRPELDSQQPEEPSSSTANLNGSINGEIRLVSKGSPMPKPVARAPLEKFSEGVVGELLYFENLSNSTGKFDVIRGLLNTMRKSKSDNDLSFGSTKSLD